MSFERNDPRAVLAWLMIVSAAACGTHSNESSAPGGPAIRTLAYVVTECHDRPTGSLARQRLEILRGGDETPVVATEVTAFELLSGAYPYCTGQGAVRFGHAFIATAGVFQRLGVSPDGSRVVFEITDNFGQFRDVGLARPSLSEDEEGIFVVRADGTDLRRLAPPSRDPAFRLVERSLGFVETFITFSPDGRTALYTDLGPGPGGVEAIQVVSLDLDDGTRRYVTTLPPAQVSDPTHPDTVNPSFLDADRIAFYSSANPNGLNPEGHFVPFTVQHDGTALMRGPVPTAAGGPAVTQFVITGPEPDAVLLTPTAESTAGVFEVFALDGDTLLQLTNFHASDMTSAVLSADQQHVFFNASVDPCGDGAYPVCDSHNPLRNCQLFSVDRVGGELRQLTHFDEGVRSNTACFFEDARVSDGCSVVDLAQDPETQALIFYSSCAPFESPDFVGAQLYAMQPDGSGLRQLTHTRGLFIDEDGNAASEIPAPLAYSSSPPRSVR